MKTSDLKAFSDSLRELNESYSDFLCSMKDTIREAKAVKKLWHDGQKPWLIKLGIALIVFPEPVISEILGSLLIAAGTVHEGLRRRTLHLEDIPKTFKNVLREINSAQERLC
ncbi:MAG: hypothetical protein NZ932_01410 [Candidatus Bathyarchaeota archaeon]|nr:hypothetical protein [Candidatus Bathyarchaeota archaeon]MDW8040089.1 hypothetical protein [Nitrososphaerota archaeon]